MPHRRAEISSQLNVKSNDISRRTFTVSIPATLISSFTTFSSSSPAYADDVSTALEAVQVAPSGEIKKLFNEGRVMEGQGNILAAQRLFAKVTKLAPRVSFGI
jgi:hypothetical protein